MPQRDIEITIDFTGGFNGRPIRPSALRDLPGIVMEEIEKELWRVAEAFEHQLILRYQDIFRDSDRPEPGEVRQAVYESIRSSVTRKMNEVMMGTFDVEHARERTAIEGYSQPSVFDMFEDGHTGLEYGSSTHGFVSLEYAMELAERLIKEFNLPTREADDFRQYVQREFQGRDGEGIMVRLNHPMFFRYPEFGKASDYVSGHPGFLAWNVLKTIDGPHSAATATRQGGRHFVLEAMDQAMARAQQRIQERMG